MRLLLQELDHEKNNQLIQAYPVFFAVLGASTCVCNVIYRSEHEWRQP